ncbi:ribosomal protein S6 kinase-related protein isoform X2 [Ornithorhynchus anatinus]|uniref:ribosomal protein S6 kinase-related protein isoform X2 n=1 Tax=Ornithorhynchus anatinus TaxID=9258 RepID=UPI0010A86003|nr:ribosomal protein S6 kinase-related protein isoform X2 [Ornithorhynchus anatinus]
MGAVSSGPARGPGGAPQGKDRRDTPGGVSGASRSRAGGGLSRSVGSQPNSVPPARGPCVRAWKSLLSGVGASGSGLKWPRWGRGPPGPPQPVIRITERQPNEWPLPQFISLFLPEFPLRPPWGEQQLKVGRQNPSHRPRWPNLVCELKCGGLAPLRLPLYLSLQVLGLVAKGSFGTILKVLDRGREAVFAVKVMPKVEVLRRDTLRQCKEERQVSHPFVHGLGDSWQGQRHLFIMCSYCSTGDLHSLWATVGSFDEEPIRLFAAELVLVLGYLHDLGITHRDVKMENILLDERGHLKLTDFGLSRYLPSGGRAYTICGTLQYMAPEVLSGGPYNHAADWWSLGVLLFCLATGKFPVAAERDHVAMLASVSRCDYAVPASLSQPLSLLLGELLCRNPSLRLRYLHRFRAHPFFRGVAFDPELLQKQPVPLILEARAARAPPPEPETFGDFDCDLVVPLTRPHPA